MKDLIIETLENSTSKYPFSVSKFWTLFGYSKKSNFIAELLKKATMGEHYIYSEYKNVRTREDILLTTAYFQKLLKERNPSVFKDYFEYRKQKIADKIGKFTKSRKKRYLHDTYREVTGEWYDYSLGSFYICRDLGIDPFEGFRIVNQTFLLDSYLGVQVMFIAITRPGNRNAYEHFPNYSFNSDKHKKRTDVFTYMKALKKKGNLDEYQLDLWATMYRSLQDMLCKQYLLHDKKKLEESYDYVNQNYDEAEMKQFYREAALLSHPDINPQGEETFKNLNQAYEQGDFYTVKHIHQNLKSQ